MIDFAKLRAPFAPDRISWRVGSTNADKTKGLALAYIDARDVQDRLDEVCGVDSWQCRYVPMHDKKTVCEIGVRIIHQSQNGCEEEWIWKSDGAGDSDVEAEKGALSDAFKRAAVRWGIGRYLYDIDSPWVALEAAGRSYKIATGEYSKLRAVLEKGAPKPSAPPTPPPADKPKMTPAQWVDRAAQTVVGFSTLVGLDAWIKRNDAAISKLVAENAALANTLTTKIDIRRRELERLVTA